MASEDAEEDESMAASPSRSGSAVVVDGSDHGLVLWEEMRGLLDIAGYGLGLSATFVCECLGAAWHWRSLTRVLHLRWINKCSGGVLAEHSRAVR